jgi:tripartite-type tricarboxylate transporter receptor subunit TctC
MMVTAARALCAELEVRSWDEVAIAEAIDAGTAALLQVASHVSPVPGAPGTWWVGASGYEALGGERRLAGELFKQATGTDLVHVPYKGAGPAINDLLGGQVTLMFSNPTSTVPHVKSGKLRALGVMDTKRNPALPDVPTAQEAGLPELSNVIEWYGIVVPAATPRAVVQRLGDSVLRAMAAPEVLERINAIGQTPSPAGAEEFARVIREDYARWQRVVKTSGAKAD